MDRILTNNISCCSSVMINQLAWRELYKSNNYVKSVFSQFLRDYLLLSNMEQNTKIIRSNKGNDKMCLNGHMYNKKHIGKTTITWRCCKSSSISCRGGLKTALDHTQVLEINLHNHASSEETISATECKMEMKDRAAASLDKPNQVSFISHT
jgi:hypothetical protein